MPWPKGRKQSPEHVAKVQAGRAATGGKRKRPRIIGGAEHWQCATCREWLPAKAFYTSKRATNGLKSQCRACHSETAIRTRDADNARDHARRSEAKRRARHAGAAVVAHLTGDELRRLGDMLGNRCLACGSAEALEWDHVVPLAAGGIHHPQNMQRLCAHCNAVKRTRFWDYRTTEQRAAIATVWRVAFEPVAPTPDSGPEPEVAAGE